MDDSLQFREIEQEVVDVQDDPTRDLTFENNQPSNRPTLYTELKIDEFEIEEENEKVENEDEQAQVEQKRDSRKRPFEWDHSYAIFNDESTVKRHIGTHSALQSVHTVKDSRKYEMFNIKQNERKKDENEHTDDETIRFLNDHPENVENSTIEVKSEYVINEEDKVEDQSEHKVMVQVEYREACNFLNNVESSLHTELKIEEHEIKFENQNEPNEVVQSPASITIDAELTCEVYNKTFAKKRNLKLHRLTHTSEKLFKCDKCDATCKFKYRYTHQLVHSNVRPFQCVICDKRFKRKGELTKHLFCHTGEKPFECHVCFMKFRGKFHLFKHCYSKHPQDSKYKYKKTYECDVCHFRFASAWHMCKCAQGV